MVFFQKIEIFVLCVFWANQDKRFCCDILERKECFLDQKKEVLKQSKKSKSFKGVSPWFRQKIVIFICVFLGRIKPEKMVC